MDIAKQQQVMRGIALVKRLVSVASIACFGLTSIGLSSCRSRKCADLLKQAQQETRAYVKLDLMNEHIECDSRSSIGYYERGNLHYEYYNQIMSMKKDGYNTDTIDAYDHLNQAIKDYSMSISNNHEYGLSYLGRARAYYVLYNYQGACSDIDSAQIYGVSVDSLLLVKCK